MRGFAERFFQQKPIRMELSRQESQLSGPSKACTAHTTPVSQSCTARHKRRMQPSLRSILLTANRELAKSIERTQRRSAMIDRMSRNKSRILTVILSVAIPAITTAQINDQDDTRTSTPFTMSPQLEAIRSATIESLTALGYVDRTDEDPRAEYVQARMQERASMAEVAGKEKNPTTLGYYDVSGGLSPAAQAYEATLVQRKFLNGRSKSYLLPGGNRIKQLHTDTLFETTIIDELKDATVTLESPNMKIGGHAATFTHLRYRGDKWATAIYVPTSNRFFVVEADRKLEGKQKQTFIEMVTTLVSSARCRLQFGNGFLGSPAHGSAWASEVSLSAIGFIETVSGMVR